jgi:hypothetical protein
MLVGGRVERNMDRLSPDNVTEDLVSYLAGQGEKGRRGRVAGASIEMLADDMCPNRLSGRHAHIACFDTDDLLRSNNSVVLFLTGK